MINSILESIGSNTVERGSLPTPPVKNCNCKSCNNKRNNTDLLYQSIFNFFVIAFVMVVMTFLLYQLIINII